MNRNLWAHFKHTCMHHWEWRRTAIGHQLEAYEKGKQFNLTPVPLTWLFVSNDQPDWYLQKKPLTNGYLYYTYWALDVTVFFLALERKPSGTTTINKTSALLTDAFKTTGTQYQRKELLERSKTTNKSLNNFVVSKLVQWLATSRQSTTHATLPPWPISLLS